MPFWEHPHTKYKKNVHHFAVGLDSNFNIGKYQLGKNSSMCKSRITIMVPKDDMCNNKETL